MLSRLKQSRSLTVAVLLRGAGILQYPKEPRA